MMEEKRVALLMCQTPLQSVIATEIIKKNPDTVFFPVYTAYQWTHKHEYYANRLLEKCGTGIKRELHDMDSIVALVKELELHHFTDMYLASIDAPLNLAALSTHDNMNVYTYDDGAANITPKSFYFRKTKGIDVPGITMTWDKQKVREVSQRHYTIFDTPFNIVPSHKLEYVTLFDVSTAPRDMDKPNAEVSIFVGQRMMDTMEAQEKLVLQVMTQFNVDYYFPAPAEKSMPLPLERVIDTPLIFEEYCQELLKQYDVIHVYHFYSTVGFTLKNHPAIHIHVIDERYYDGWYFSL